MKILHRNVRQSLTLTLIFSDPNATAEQILNAKRDHWEIENCLHWRLDVAYDEYNWALHLIALNSVRCWRRSAVHHGCVRELLSERYALHRPVSCGFVGERGVERLS